VQPEFLLLGQRMSLGDWQFNTRHRKLIQFFIRFGHVVYKPASRFPNRMPSICSRLAAGVSEQRRGMLSRYPDRPRTRHLAALRLQPAAWPGRARWNRMRCCPAQGEVAALHCQRRKSWHRLCWDNTLSVLARPKAPRLYGAPLDKNDSSKAMEIFRRFRRTVSCEVLRSGDENDHRLRESSGNQCGVWKFT
jgi:hypothetical protein